ncbi:MAG TPA: histidine kinase dimerization/phosphoacceptor domain -containing protein [Rhizomicrobium sp.]|nr:histidine kinase dimerization/phosphoacceptor domain -containing protein [Rhizomicrobium sp.]
MLSEPIIFTPRPSSKEGRLAREANHRIANHLMQLAGLVQIQIVNLGRKPSDVDPRALLREVVSKIASLSQLHRHLAERPDEDQIELGDFLIQSGASIVSLLSLSDRIRVVYRLDTKCEVRASIAHSFGLMLGEIMMNAVKHAHPTGLPVVVTVSCRRRDGSLNVEIGDDGVGLPEGFNAETDGGTGFQIIRALAKGAEMNLSIESDSLGLSFCLTLPEQRCEN